MLYLLNEFRDAVATSRRLIAAAHITDATGTYTWVEADRSLAVEAAFLKTFIAWETIQERAFVEYLMGTASASGNVIPRFVQPNDRVHAARLLVGLLRYVDWSNPEHPRKLAMNFLAGGEPFERVLASLHGDLIDIKTIRNSAAHLSSTTAQPLDALASRKLQRSVSGMSAAAFLLSTDPTSVANSTVFDSCILILDTAAHSIVHA